MLKKQYVKSRMISKVTFSLPKSEYPAGVVVESVSLVGDFNGWNPVATPMIPNARGIYRTTLELEPGREYTFRYLVNGEHWCNDWHADAYAANEFGGENCVVQTPVGGA